MNRWLLAAAVLLAAGLLPLALAAARSEAMSASVALNLGGPVATVILLLLAQGVHRQPFVDLALVLAAVSFAGSIVLARFLEWRT